MPISTSAVKIASLSSFTFSDFGDLNGENSGLEGVFGKRDYYVDRINGQDTLLRNEDPYVQKFSGFKQYDFLEKLFLPKQQQSAQPEFAVQHLFEYSTL